MYCESKRLPKWWQRLSEVVDVFGQDAIGSEQEMAFLLLTAFVLMMPTWTLDRVRRCAPCPYRGQDMIPHPIFFCIPSFHGFSVLSQFIGRD